MPLQSMRRASNINNNYRDFPLVFLGGDSKDIVIVGDYWQIISATGAVTLQFDNGSSITRYNGMGGPQDYTRITVSSAIAQSVTIAAGVTNGLPPYDGRATLAGVTVTATVKVPNLILSLPDVVIGAASRQLIDAGDANRISLLMSLPGMAPGAVRYGDVTVAAAQGQLLEPGDKVSLDGTAAVYVWNPNAGAVTVSSSKTRLV